MNVARIHAATTEHAKMEWLIFSVFVAMGGRERRVASRTAIVIDTPAGMEALVWIWEIDSRVPVPTAGKVPSAKSVSIVWSVE